MKRSLYVHLLAVCLLLAHPMSMARLSRPIPSSNDVLWISDREHTELLEVTPFPKRKFESYGSPERPVTDTFKSELQKVAENLDKSKQASVQQNETHSTENLESEQATLVSINPYPRFGRVKPDGTIQTCSKEHFEEQLKAIPRDKSVIIYVHGCCDSFDDAMHDARLLADYTNARIIAYDWPTKKLNFSLKNPFGSLMSTFGYRANEESYEVYKDNFVQLLDVVESLGLPSSNTYLVAHSMGSRFVEYALAKKKRTAKYAASIFACADLNLWVFLHDFNLLAQNCPRIVLIENLLDPALSMSVLAHSGGVRASRFNIPVVWKRFELVDDTDLMGATHDFPFAVVTKLVNPDSSEIKLWRDANGIYHAISETHRSTNPLRRYNRMAKQASKQTGWTVNEKDPPIQNHLVKPEGSN